MAHFTTIKARGVGLVEIFRNPASREWHDLVRLADPVDGLRAYHIDGALYVWGSLPLHQDLRPWLMAEIGSSTGSWIGLQLAPLLNTVTVTEVTSPKGELLEIAGVRGTLQRSLPLTRLLGRDVVIRRMSAIGLPSTVDRAIATLVDLRHRRIRRCRRTMSGELRRP